MTDTARLAPQPWMTAPDTRAVLDALAAGGVEARFVGGCVRDAWLGRPVKDIDLASPAPPERVMELLAAAGLRALPTGIAHGTVTALSGGKPHEITTLRRDVESFGRHARVAFTDDWVEDASRRDLTMNAMNCTGDGVIHDPFGGLADLAAGRVRFVGDPRRRIEEDVLRLLRFFRFHAHYGRGEPDAEALAACTELAPRLPTLSGERVQAELLRLLSAPDAPGVWRLMIERGVMAHLLPMATATGRLERMVGLEEGLGGMPASVPPPHPSPASQGRGQDPCEEPGAVPSPAQRGRVREGAPKPEPVHPDPLRRLAAVLETDRAGALSVAETLRLSNADRDRLAALVERRAPLSLSDDRTTRRQALYRLGDAALYRDLLLMAAADATTPPDLATLRAVLATAADLPALTLPIAGRDLLALGVVRGPEVGRLLKAVEAWWIAEDFQPDRAACLAHLETLRNRIA